MKPMDVFESILRWFHVIFGVLWIGHLYFFNFVNANFAPTMDGETKKKVVPELMPRALFWFRMGALMTWITGFLLMGMVFYMKVDPATGHNSNMFGPEIAGAPTWGGLQLAMLALTFLGVFLYDVIVKAVLKTPVAQFWGGFVLVCAALYGFKAAGFGMRAYQIHLGAMFGTIMAFNVWFRIWPAQKQIITAIKGGTAPDAALVAMAGARSKHNTFMSVPLIFTMLNNHNTWAASYDSVAPFLTMGVVLLGWGFTQHLYAAAKKVKGF